MTSTAISNSLLEKNFQQKDEAKKIIKRHTLYAAGLGFLPIPIVDAVSITANQIWMIRDISKIYNIPFKQHLVKSFIGSLVGTTGAIGLVKFIPGVGSILGGTTVSVGAATATYALGQLFMEHFYQGGTLLDFDPVKSRAYFQKLYTEHESTVKTLQEEEQKQSITASSGQTALEDVKKRVLHFKEQQQKNAPIIASLQQAKETALVTEIKEPINQEENDQDIIQLAADKIALTTTLEEVVQENFQAQEKWGEQEKVYLNSQQANQQEIIDLIAASKAREEEIIALQQQVKESTKVSENNTLQYEKSQAQLKQSFVDLRQEVKEKETFKKQVAQQEVHKKAQEQKVQVLETTTQQHQKTISALRKELQVKEDTQKKNWFWWLLLPLLLLLGGFAGFSYGKKTANTIGVIQKEGQLGPDGVTLGFEPNSAEAAMADHLSNPASNYPKTFWTKNIYFEPNATQPATTSNQQIENIALLASHYPTRKMRIYSHTDEIEGQSAGVNRAEIIATILKNKGVKASQILTHLIKKPVEGEGNRGVEFELLNE